MELDIEELKYRNSVLEGIANKVQLHREVTMNSHKVIEILDALGDWSYSHRRGNGELSEEQTKHSIDKAFARLAELALGGDMLITLHMVGGEAFLMNSDKIVRVLNPIQKGKTGSTICTSDGLFLEIEENLEAP